MVSIVRIKTTMNLSMAKIQIEDFRATCANYLYLQFVIATIRCQWYVHNAHETGASPSFYCRDEWRQ